MTASLKKTFEEKLQHSKRILPGEKIFVACSAGSDSTALLHLLRNLQAAWGLKIGVLHFNHGLRGRDSDRDEAFVRNLAKAFQFPFYSAKRVLKKQPGKLSLEEVARESRYQFFIRMARRYRIPKIILAHTQDDQAETILMRILQGTGLRGLMGVRPLLVMKKIAFVRPLLDFSKADLLRYAADEGIRSREDVSNRETKFLRNKIRHRLLPVLKREFNPKVSEALARIPSILSQENELVSWLEESAWRRLVKRKLGEKIYLDRKVFDSFPAALQFRMIARALKVLDPRSGIQHAAWLRLEPNLTRKKFRFSLPRDLDLALTPSRLLLFRK